MIPFGPTQRSVVVAILVATLSPAAVPLRSTAWGVELNDFTHGPILGRLSSDGVGVWARTVEPGPFAVRFGTDPERLDQLSEPVETELAHDNTGWVHLKGLESDTFYHYRLEIPDNPGPIGLGGTFRTLPDADDYQHPEYNPEGLFNFAFEFACGNNQNFGDGSGPGTPAFATMLRELRGRIHFAILNGDWLYESRRDFDAERWQAQVGRLGEPLPAPLDIAPTLAGVWQNYKQFLTRGEYLKHWHRQVPSFFTYDDHEILNDVWGAGTVGLRDRRAVFRDIGVRAWYDYLAWSNPTSFPQPIRFGRAQLVADGDVLTDPEASFGSLDLEQVNNLHVHWGTPTAGINDNALDGVGGDPNAGVYRIVEVLDDQRLRIEPPADADGVSTYSIGRRSYFRMRVSNCDFFVLDTRGQRELHDTRRPDQPGLSMLGPVQRDWLLEGVRSSDADFIFVVSSVNFMVPHVGGGKIRTTNKDDAWTVFLDERETLIETFDALDKPVLVLTGDLHNSFAIKVTDNVWEFASGPHNSNNHWATDEGDRPPNGPFQYGPRPVEIRWSTYFLPDIPREDLQYPHYCVVQVNNIFNNPDADKNDRWIRYPRPQLVVQYYDGLTGDLKYAEAIHANAKP